MTQSNKRRSPRNQASAPKAAASEVDAGRISPEELTALISALLHHLGLRGIDCQTGEFYESDAAQKEEVDNA